jgi:septal ring factor EnvC (AmiA/AmiB activator)
MDEDYNKLLIPNMNLNDFYVIFRIDELTKEELALRFLSAVHQIKNPELEETLRNTERELDTLQESIDEKEGTISDLTSDLHQVENKLEKAENTITALVDQLAEIQEEGKKNFKTRPKMLEPGITKLEAISELKLTVYELVQSADKCSTLKEVIALVQSVNILLQKITKE